MKKKFWVRLFFSPHIDVPLTETDVPNVYKTEPINRTFRGEVLHTFEHLRVDAVSKKLYYFDKESGIDRGFFSSYLPVAEVSFKSVQRKP